MVFISHNLADILAVSDRIVVLRRGVKAGERSIAAANPDEIVRFIVGGDISRPLLMIAVALMRAYVLLRN